jgi:hypothetical protein
MTVPPKALVWHDDQGRVWVSAEYLYKTINPRHGESAVSQILGGD